MTMVPVLSFSQVNIKAIYAGSIIVVSDANFLQATTYALAQVFADMLR